MRDLISSFNIYFEEHINEIETAIYSLADWKWIVQNFVAGIFISVLASIFFTIILGRFRPKIKFSRYVCLRKENDEEYYLIKFRNIGHRIIYNLKIEVKLVIKRTIHGGVINTTLNLPLLRDNLSILDLYKPKLRTGHFTVNFYLNNSVLEHLKNENNRKKFIDMSELEDSNLNLIQLMGIFPESEIRCFVTGTDPFSSMTSVLMQKFYKDNIKLGFFEASSLRVITNEDKSISISEKWQLIKCTSKELTSIIKDLIVLIWKSVKRRLSKN